MELRSSLTVVCLFVAISAAPAIRAQEDPSKIELYGSYDYVRFNINAKVSGQPPSQTFNANGGGGELEYNVNNWLGVLGDVGGYWATSSTRDGAAGAAIPYLFGPRVSFRRGVVRPSCKCW